MFRCWDFENSVTHSFNFLPVY
ncbi:CRISPR-associated DxTHG motif protein [Bacillus sp. MUM 116]